MFKLLAVLMIFFISSVSREIFADDSRFSFLLNTHLPFGGIDQQETKLQRDTSTNALKFDYTFLKGSENGLLLGAGYGSERSQYIQTKTSTERQSGKFESNYRFYYLRLGYWAKLEKGIIEGSLNPGVGNFQFQRYSPVNGSKKSNSGTYSLALDLRYNYPVKLNQKLSMDLIFGGGLNKNFVKDFKYEGGKYNSSEFDVDGFLTFGIGFRF